MGYSTSFKGKIDICPTLNNKEIKFLAGFSNTRRVQRTQGPYYVGGSDRWNVEADRRGVTDSNNSPTGQPGLWCDWIPTKDGNALIWNKCEKFYDSAEWLVYLIQHFLCRKPLAKKTLTFLQGHELNGTIAAQGDSPDDRWLLVVQNNQVRKKDVIIVPVEGEGAFIGGGN